MTQKEMTQQSHYEFPSPQLALFSENRLLAAWGLMRRVEETPNVSARTQQVFDAMAKYAVIDLPLGLTDQLYQFFCVTAGLGLWDTLDAKNPKIADTLLAYYMNGDSRLIDVASIAGRATPDGVMKLLDQGIDLLWEGLPNQPSEEFPLDKQKRFPKNELQRTRAPRRFTDRGLGGKMLWAKAHANPELASRLLQGLQQGREVMAERRKARQSQQNHE